jgi:DNA-binding NarL/FixJ family response regulator
MQKQQILIISEQTADFTTLTAALSRVQPSRYDVLAVSTLEQPVEALMDGANHAVILTHTLETEYLLRLAQKAALPTPIVVLIDLESEPLIHKLMDAGAADYLVRGALGDNAVEHVLERVMAAAWQNAEAASASELVLEFEQEQEPEREPEPASPPEERPLGRSVSVQRVSQPVSRVARLAAELPAVTESVVVPSVRAVEMPEPAATEVLADSAAPQPAGLELQQAETKVEVQVEAGLEAEVEVEVKASTVTLEPPRLEPPENQQSTTPDVGATNPPAATPTPTPLDTVRRPSRDQSHSTVVLAVEMMQTRAARETAGQIFTSPSANSGGVQPGADEPYQDQDQDQDQDLEIDLEIDLELDSAVEPVRLEAGSEDPQALDGNIDLDSGLNMEQALQLDNEPDGISERAEPAASTSVPNDFGIADSKSAEWAPHEPGMDEPYLEGLAFAGAQIPVAVAISRGRRGKAKSRKNKAPKRKSSKETSAKRKSATGKDKNEQSPKVKLSGVDTSRVDTSGVDTSGMEMSARGRLLPKIPRCPGRVSTRCRPRPYLAMHYLQSHCCQRNPDAAHRGRWQLC